MTQKNYPDSSSVEYVYDLVGKVMQVNDPTGTNGFAYDNMGRLIGTTTSKLPAGADIHESYTYDAASNRTGFTAPDGSTNSYSYDTLNRLNNLTNSLTGSFGFSYDQLSRRTQMTRPNGVNTNYSYDTLSRLLSVLHQSGSTTLDGASYTYDNVGNRVSKANYLNNVTEGYAYDALYQLAQVTQGSSTTESYSFDSVGNRLSSLGMSPYSHNSANELTSTPAGSYTYDANGNTLSDASGRQYSWDFNNRLTQAIVPNVGTTTFRYDPFGRRIQKSGPLGTTNYLYDQVDLLEELDNTGNVLARYSHGVGYDQPVSMTRASTASYYQSDVLSTITSLSDATGAIASTYIFDEFGNQTASTGSITNPFRFTGREFDTETGINFYRARYYDQGVGRFMSEDPLRIEGGINFFAYTLNNPANWIDPLGLEVQECRRPLSFDPTGDLPPHTFLYSTQSGKGYGLGPKNMGGGLWSAETGKPVHGTIELDYPYDPSGKLRPKFSCSKYSDDDCIERCVNRKSKEAMEHPPNWQIGNYQCDTWANDIEQQCTKECKK